MHRRISTRNVPKQRYDCSEEQLDYCNRIPGRSVDYSDTEGRRSVEGNVIDSNAGPPNDLELTGLLQQLCRNPRGAATDDRIIVDDPGKQLVLEQRRHFFHDDLRLSAKDAETSGVDLILDQ